MCVYTCALLSLSFSLALRRKSSTSSSLRVSSATQPSARHTSPSHTQTHIRIDRYVGSLSPLRSFSCCRASERGRLGHSLRIAQRGRNGALLSRARGVERASETETHIAARGRIRARRGSSSSSSGNSGRRGGGACAGLATTAAAAAAATTTTAASRGAPLPSADLRGCDRLSARASDVQALRGAATTTTTTCSSSSSSSSSQLTIRD